MTDDFLLEDEWEPIHFVPYAEYERLENLQIRIQAWYPDWKPNHWMDVLAKAEELGFK